MRDLPFRLRHHAGDGAAHGGVLLRRPVGLLIEDAQWLDDASREFLLNLEHELAIRDFDAAISLTPDNPNLFLYRSWERWDLDDAMGSLQDLDHALLLDPDNVKVLARRATVSFDIAAPGSRRLMLRRRPSL